MKKSIFSLILISTLVLTECKADQPANKTGIAGSDKEVIQLTTETFKKLIFNYEEGTEFKYSGKMPAIIDFYADWCAPCRQLSPVVEEIAKEYSGKIVVYKVDTDNERVLAEKLGITGLPTLLFIPLEGQPQVTMGALPKESLIKAVNDILKVRL